MTGRRAEADDLSQEAIARAIERADDLHDVAAAEGWLFRIATTVCLDHSRFAVETNGNYGNIFSVFDRLCGTFTRPERGPTVVYGLAGFDAPAMQSVRGLLAMPFRNAAAGTQSYGRAGIVGTASNARERMNPVH